MLNEYSPVGRQTINCRIFIPIGNHNATPFNSGYLCRLAHPCCRTGQHKPGSHHHPQRARRADHELANGWQIDARYSYTFSKREQHYGVAGTFNIQPNGAARLNSGHWEYTPKEHLADISLSGKYPLLGREQPFKIGVNFNHYDDYHNPLSRRVQQPVANIFTYHAKAPSRPPPLWATAATKTAWRASTARPALT